MCKLVLSVILAVALLAGPAVTKPQVLVDAYGYYAAAPAYVASAYSAPVAYTYPYAYAYTYPYAYV